MHIVVKKQSQHLGVRFWQTPESEVLLVHMDDHGIFASSGLTRVKVGMTIRRIDGVLCQSTVEALRLLEMAPLGSNIRLQVCLPNACSTAQRNNQNSSSVLPSTPMLPTIDKTDTDDNLTCTDVSESSDEGLSDNDDDDDDEASIWTSDERFTAQDNIFFLF